MFIATTCRTGAWRALGMAVRNTKAHHAMRPAQPWVQYQLSSQPRQARRLYGQLPVATTVAPAKAPNNKDGKSGKKDDATKSDGLVIYEGPFAQTARRLKLFSVSSLGATVALCPFIFILDAGISTGMRGGLAVAAVATSGSSTALVQWCLGSYVRKMTIPKTTSSITAAGEAVVDANTPVSFETLSFWGGTRTTTVRVKDLEPSSAPFSTIRIRAGGASQVHDGRTGRLLSQGSQLQKRFYLHAEMAEQEEPLRSIMALVEQRRSISTEDSSNSNNNNNNNKAAEAVQGLDSREPAAAQTETGTMSDRIDALKRKKAGAARGLKP